MDGRSGGLPPVSRGCPTTTGGEQGPVLPPEVLVEVFGYLQEPHELSGLAQVCRSWRQLSETDCLWRELFRRRWRRATRQPPSSNRDQEPMSDATRSSTSTETSTTASTSTSTAMHEQPTLETSEGAEDFETFCALHKPPELGWKVFINL